MFFSLFALLNHAHAATQNPCYENTPGQNTNRFSDQGDGTVLDTQTKLIWQRCNLGESWHVESETCKSFPASKNWRDSLASIKPFNDTQFANGLPDDWRMPNLKELASIVDVNCPNQTMNTLVFPSARASYWTSTPNAGDVNQAKILDANQVLTGYRDENLIWTIHTLTGRERAEPLSLFRSTLLVRGPDTP